MTDRAIRNTNLPWLGRIPRAVKRYSPPWNFITLHYAYFVSTSLISAVILWGSSTPPRSLSFIDSLFLAVSAISCAGLNTVNLSELNSFQQVVLFLLIMLGSVILVSAAVIYIRRTAFEKRFSSIVDRHKKENGRLLRSRLANHQAVESRKYLSHAPEVDGVVVRGAAIHGEMQSEESKHNPGNRPPPEQRNGDILLTAARPGRGNLPQAFHSVFDADSISEDNTAKDKDLKPSALPALRFAKSTEECRHRRVFSFSGVGARQDLLNHPRTAYSYDRTLETTSNTGFRSSLNAETEMSSGPRIGRNSQFSSLTRAERATLGGVEYRALKLLQIVVLMYYVLFQLFGCIGLGAWVSINASEIAQNNGLNAWWVGAFNAVSAFNNSGMSLVDANMVAFQWSYYMMITMGMLILVGNTCYPVVLRLIFWVLWKLTPSSEEWKDDKVALRFILDHPRRVYTNLFPSSHTWFLVGTILALNTIDWLGFEILNIGNTYVQSLPSNLRVIDGLFQAVAVRSGGFYVVPIANIAIAVQVLYVLMMYISVYPVTMTMRNSNVYEERSLGIYAGDIPHSGPPTKTISLSGKNTNLLGRLYADTGTHSRSYFVRQQLRSQLAHDLWWICLAVLIIMIIEGGQFATDPVAYSVFNVVFEVVSGYGTVGISVGLPNQAYSFCGGWHALSKLILCAVMLRGRHRGLPVAIDRAVLLPDEHLADAEEEDARLAADGAFESSNLAIDRSASPDIMRSRATNSRSDQIV